MKKKYLFIIVICLCNTLHAQVRQTINFNNGWKFYLGNDSAASNQNYNDASWRTLNLPHDWSIEGNFSKDNPATTQGGALPGGIGWYRKTFRVPSSSQNKNITVEFDGVYRNSEVWINGHYLGKRPNGYISFSYDLTSYLKFGNEKNVIAVKVDNSQQPNSRWYSGSGIYRNVRLIEFGNTFIEKSSVYVRTPIVDKDNATIIVGLSLENKFEMPGEVYAVYTSIYDGANSLIYDAKKKYLDTLRLNGKETKLLTSIEISKPKLWSVEHPNLYKAVTQIIYRGKIIDESTTTFGIRSFHFDREKGFFLNNQPLKIKGVCMHHDLGALGTAFNYRAAERQLQILKDMGCNAIRTSHNPPATEFLDLCDKMGFLVMDEAFDMWQKKKNKFDYAADFKQWHKQDLEDMILRDRNHPSVLMWSIGNEIREQFDSTGIALTKELAGIVKRLDPTRSIISALTETDTLKNYIYQADALDVYGWNYNEQKYPDALKNYPGKIFIAAETTSALETRGQYDITDTIRTWPPKGTKEMENVNGNWAVSAYDNVKSNWGSTHETTWKIIKKYDFLSGLFVWTGFDYLGEPTPFPWPARSSYFGIVDLAGFPKDVYYMYQSEWTTKPVLHILPHWNPERIGASWPLGKIVDVWAYYNNADEVELFLNGKSLGIQKKMNDDLHVQWRVPYEPGILKAISRKNGKIVLTETIKTAGAPYAIELTADRKNIKADGNDLSFITAKIVDKEGNIVPDANNTITFSITGNATIAATDNGYQADTTSFASTKRNAWKGMALAIIRPSTKKGNSTLTANATGLQQASITLKITQ